MKQVLNVVLVDEVHCFRTLSSISEWVHCTTEALNDDLDYLINGARLSRNQPRCYLTELIDFNCTTYR